MGAFNRLDHRFYCLAAVVLIAAFGVVGTVRAADESASPPAQSSSKSDSEKSKEKPKSYKPTGGSTSKKESKPAPSPPPQPKPEPKPQPKPEPKPEPAPNKDKPADTDKGYKPSYTPDRPKSSSKPKNSNTNSDTGASKTYKPTGESGSSKPPEKKRPEPPRTPEHATRPEARPEPDSHPKPPIRYDPAPSTRTEPTAGEHTAEPEPTQTRTDGGYIPTGSSGRPGTYEPAQTYRPDQPKRYRPDVYRPPVEDVRVIIERYPEVVYVDRPVYEIDDYLLDNPPLSPMNQALADIRVGFLAGRFDLIAMHVRPGDTIAVTVDGRYDYSVTGEDYLALTHDALESLQTVGFVWEDVRPRADGAVTAFASHSFLDTWGHGGPELGEAGESVRLVYASFTLRRVGSEYYVREVGSSDLPAY